MDKVSKDAQALVFRKVHVKVFQDAQVVEFNKVHVKDVTISAPNSNDACMAQAVKSPT